MNPCGRYEVPLTIFFHQELRRRAGALQKHLSQCEKCRGYLGELDHVFQVVESHYESSSDLFLDIQW